MPDITLCVNDRCPLRETCGRYEGNWDELSERQSYAKFAPDYDALGGVIGCGWFEEKGEKIKL